MNNAKYPRTDAAWLDFGSNYSDQLNLSPAVYGVTVDEATSIKTLFLELETSYAAVGDPLTRTAIATRDKNNALKIFRAAVGRLNKRIRGFEGITDRQLMTLGLTPPDPKPTPAVLPPGALLVVLGVRNNEVEVMVSDPLNPKRRSKPDGVDGISYFSLLAAEPVADITKWTFMGNSGKPRLTLPFPAELPAGTKVFLSASFFNTRKVSGAASPPIAATLAGGGMSALPTKAARPAVKLAA